VVQKDKHGKVIHYFTDNFVMTIEFAIKLDPLLTVKEATA